ncbi:MAG: hypothetical protein KKC79_05750 [Gammaproteobacteria bacterium]|nr:hypothetical protein [Gammaproteobacteria bacterium]MBU1441462.1 hypothetical protein [Gammaproteobacteria bacterium]MBU2287291.1 hypothetical protein [Gammaproteobacteria bacterium]MBU2408139.1 hypothetical protein [Gammaproteobacteria bacterium]
MGLLDFFGKKKKEDQEAAELMKALIQYQVESRKDGVDTDDIPKGYGPYGLCKTNPVPTRGIPGSNEYLSRLRTKDGRSIESSRIGSTSAEDVTSGAIDMYCITSGDVSFGTVYLCPYHKRNSGKAPEGFRLL